jgi:indolepyruvate ferredoxin oxidoreductase
LAQASSDRAAGLNTAGFVSGYRGSPLGGLDQELWRAKALLDEARVEFLPAINEDLAATAVLGSQQVETDPDRTVDGVFALWYGKGPGVDRSGDALKHGNAYGSSPHGGVLVVAGDDHGCVSSSMPHQSDPAFLSWFMPILNPASVAEYEAFGIYGYALSRFSGMWVGFKAISETVESAMSVELRPPPRFVAPTFTYPSGGLHYRWPDLPGPQIEERLEAKKAAVQAFVRANPIDRLIFDTPAARYGIVTTGKAHGDLMEALRLLGIDRDEARRIGLDVYKVGIVWPLAHDQALEFVRDKQEVLVVEEKRGIIESQFKEYFYNFPGHKPRRMVGKEDEDGQRLVPWIGELSPRMLLPILARRLDAIIPGLALTERADRLAAPAPRIEIAGAKRVPYFCSGCPHSSSTKVPEGSKALAGIGCHFMASWMDRRTESLIQMGGEGVNWVARSKFNGNKHIFQNLGEGTYYHSGSMAIRQAVAAKTNITYKILFNDAVAMTGGQPVDGPISVEAIAATMRAEGAVRIAVVSDEPGRYHASAFPFGTTIHHRDALDVVQRELRDIPGVTILIFEQTCAAEKRKRRKRGQMTTPARTVVVNELVCEGCGDCSVESNCLSVVPIETEFGRKRMIDQNSCNKDFSCLNGFCPSFVTVEGEIRVKAAALDHAGIGARANALIPPKLPSVDRGFDLLVVGVGGTGVVTTGAIIAMAAHLEGKGASVLDFMGFAQKGGPVLSYVRFSSEPSTLNQARIDECSADAVIACDLVVASSPQASRSYRPNVTRAVINTTEIPTSDIVLRRDATVDPAQRIKSIAAVVGEKNVATLPANVLAESHLGDVVYTNVMMLGAAWQNGLVPVSLAAIERAIELNGVAIKQNKQAFALGRVAVADPALGAIAAPERQSPSLDQIIERRAAFLVDYQNEKLADRFRRLTARVRQREAAVSAGEELTAAVAKAYFKLLSYKDEYEVARLHADTGFLEKIGKEFTGDVEVRFHVAPPLLAAKPDARGRPKKRSFGSWILPAFKVLSRMKRLRGTAFDPFGYTSHRRLERSLIPWFEEIVDALLKNLSVESLPAAIDDVLQIMEIRGYGPVKEVAIEHVKRQIERKS